MAEQRTPRPRGPSVRLKLALSYAGFLMLAGVLLIAVVWVFLLRYVPDQAVNAPIDGTIRRPGGFQPTIFIPGRSDLWAAFAPKAAAALGVLLVAGLVGGWILAGRMLSPLTQIGAATRRATEGSLGHRIELPGRNDEFRRLADDFDTMLARLEAHVAEQQRFAANASHELRTPLAITQALLDVAREDPDRNTDELIERLASVNGRAIDLTEALLMLSRADRGTFTPEPVDLSLVAEEASETLLPLAERRGIALETSGEAAETSGSPTLLLQLVTNLVHNAIVHNLDAGGEIRVTTGTRAGSVALTVENTGDVLDPQLVATLAEPFQRGARRTHTDHAGVGLGLAIARSITRAHGGELELTARADGGLRATALLPRR